MAYSGIVTLNGVEYPPADRFRIDRDMDFNTDILYCELFTDEDIKPVLLEYYRGCTAFKFTVVEWYYRVRDVDSTHGGMVVVDATTYEFFIRDFDVYDHDLPGHKEVIINGETK